MYTYNDNIERVQEDQQFLFLIQDSFLTQHVLEPSMGRKCNIYSFIITKRISGQCENT